LPLSAIAFLKKSFSSSVSYISYWHMSMTKTHDRSLHPSVLQSRPELLRSFNEMAEMEARVWGQFHKFWMGLDDPTAEQQPEDRQPPHEGGRGAVGGLDVELLIIRFEDLWARPAQTVARFMGFLLGDPRWDCKQGAEALLGHPHFGPKIRRATSHLRPPSPPPPASSSSGGSSGSGGGAGLRLPLPYQPRSCGGPGKSVPNYAAGKLEAMRQLAGPQLLQSLGYGEGAHLLPLLSREDVTPLPFRFARRTLRVGMRVRKGEVATSSSGGGFVFNRGNELRNQASAKWGRRVTRFRHKITARDRLPLPLAPRSGKQDDGKGNRDASTAQNQQAQHSMRWRTKQLLESAASRSKKDAGEKSRPLSQRMLGGRAAGPPADKTKISQKQEDEAD